VHPYIGRIARSSLRLLCCLVFLETKNSLTSILPLIVLFHLHSNFSSGLRKTIFSERVRFGSSRSTGVIDFGTNQKRVCDFLLFRHSNLGSISHRFRDTALQVFELMTPPLFHSNCGVFPLHQIAHVGVSASINLELINRGIIFDVFQPV